MSSTVSLPAGRLVGQSDLRWAASAHTSLLVRVALICVLANVALLVLQQVSFRLLAPIIGSSVETWSTIIAVYLLGIALGNVVGGQLADRRQPLATIRWCTVLGAATALGMLAAAEFFKQFSLLEPLSLWGQIVIVSLAVCFLPGFTLSLLTPLAIKAVMCDARDAGRVAGWVYALGTAGSLLGNYLTGFALIPHLGVRKIVLVVAGGLFAAAWLAWGRSSAGRSRASSTFTTEHGSVLQPVLFGRMPLACTIVFLCSFVSGSLESAAFRMLAPQVGVSIFLSTGVVGVILCGMAIGNALGGRIAGSLTKLKASLAVGGCLTIAVVPILRAATNTPPLEALPLVPKILLWSFALFFLPSLALGTITPQVIRLLVSDLARAGRIAGRVYAWSTAGCIVGILATGWSLIELLGACRLVVLAGLLLIPLAAALGEQPLGRWFKSHWRLACGMFAGGALFAALIDSPYDLETRYFSIAVLDGQREGRAVKRLVLDRLVHSEVDLNDPHWLGYKHEVIQGYFARLCREEAESSRVLVIGGGGYTFPRWLENQPDLADVVVEVVEIDPGVTEIAYRRLGLPRDTRVLTHNLDGRQFVKQASAGAYQLIVQDAVNDYSVPYHLMTKEYNDLVRRTLSRDGVYLLTVIDSLTEGPFIRAAVRTVQASFPEVRVLAPRGNWDNAQRCVYVIAAFGSTDHAREMLSRLPQQNVHILPPDRLAAILAQDGQRGVVLTDDFAPVDTLMTRVYLGNP